MTGLADSYGFSSNELHKLTEVIENNKDLIKRKWDEYFGKRDLGGKGNF